MKLAKRRPTQVQAEGETLGVIHRLRRALVPFLRVRVDLNAKFGRNNGAIYVSCGDVEAHFIDEIVVHEAAES